MSAATVHRRKRSWKPEEPKELQEPSGCKRTIHEDQDSAVLQENSSYSQYFPPVASDVSGGSRVNSNRLQREFFDVSCEDLAKTLLGQVLVRRLPGGDLLAGKIVETECYLGGEDKASHSYGGKRTPRNAPMYMQPGTAYVYITYGMYCCFNISSREPGAAVLIRALEPLRGMDVMRRFRAVRRVDGGERLKPTELCGGPSRMCQAMDVRKEASNGKDLAVDDDLWLEKGEAVREDQIVHCKRIGIESAGEEWANKPLRFYIFGSGFVSVRNRVAERFLEANLQK